MVKLKLVVETVGERREDYKTEIDSLADLTRVVELINESEDASFILVGDLAVRAGNIKTMYIEGAKQ